MAVALATSTEVATIRKTRPTVDPLAQCPRDASDVVLGPGAGHHEENEREREKWSCDLFDLSTYLHYYIIVHLV